MEPCISLFSRNEAKAPPANVFFGARAVNEQLTIREYATHEMVSSSRDLFENLTIFHNPIRPQTLSFG
ncbi:Hypothetical predicted protein, partial [Olea europaea subsp. europaea]